MANNNNMFLGNNSLNNFMNNTGFIAKATPTNSLISEAAKKSINEYVDSLGLEGMDKQLKIQELTQKTLKAKKQQEYNQGRADVKNDLAWKSMNASNEAEAQAYKSQGKLADLADMVRGYIRNAEGREIAGNDDEIVAAFLKDNQDMVAPFASYMSGDQSAYEFAQMFGFNATPQEIATDKSNRGWKSSLIGGEGERNDDILGHFDYTSYDEAGEGFWNKAGTFGLNLLKSTYNLGSDVVNMVANPIDTTNNLAKMLVGGAMNLTTLDDYLDPDGEGWLNSANQVADGLGDILKERYGSWEGIKNTAYTDPMGMVSDIASIIEGGAGLAKGVTKGAALGAAKAGMKGAASNLDNVSNYAGKVANIAHKADPFVEMMEGGAKGVKYLGNKAINSKTAGKIKDSATNLTDSIVGLDNETKKAIQSNPYAGSTWREVENYIDENGLPTRSQEVSKSLIADLSTAVQEDLKQYINQFNETGPLYKSLKNGNYSVDLTKAEYKTKLDDFLKEKGVIIGEDGSLNFSDTAVTPTEASAIRRAYNWLVPNEAQPVAQYIRHRKGIDQLGLWEDAKGTPGKEILKGMRELANEEAHNQIKPLKELDKLYSEQVDLLNKATEGLVYRDKRRFGEYRDNFNQILKNMDTPNRKRLKDRLEKILPGLEQKVSAINLMPKLIDNYYRPGKADKRLSSAGGVVGTALGGGLPGLAVGAGVGYGLSKLYDKIKTNKWNKAISNLSDEGKAKMAEIEKAIAANKALSAEQKAALKNIASELKANKAVKEGQIAEIMGKLTEVENIDQLDNLIAEARKIGATDAVKELEQIKEQAVKDMAEQAEMDAYEKQFNEVEKGQILDEAADQRLPEFKKRIYQLEQQEKRVGTVAGKKIGKTFEGKDWKKKQDTDWLRAKDKLIEEIAEYYNVDQFEAMDIYDRIYKSVGPDDMGLGKSQASSKTAKYQVADEEIKPNASSPEDLSHVNDEGLSVMDSFVSKKQELKAKNVSKDLLDRNGNPYLWTHTNKYMKRVISDFQNVEDSRYKEFTNKGKEIAWFTNNANMSHSYADYKSKLAPTRRFSSVDDVNKFLSDNPNTYEKEFANGGNLKSSQTYKIEKTDNGYDLISESKEVVTQSMEDFYKDLNNDWFGNNIGDMPKNKVEALEKLQKYYEDNPYTDGEIKIKLLDNGDVERTTIKTGDPTKTFKTEQQAIAEGSTFGDYSDQYHYQGIIQDVKNPLVVEVKGEGNNPSLWNSLGNAGKFFRENHKDYEAKFQNLRNKISEALDERSKFSYGDLRKLWDAKDRAYEEYTKAKKEWMGDSTAIDKAVEDMDILRTARENIESMLFNRGGKPMELPEKMRNFKVTDDKTIGDIYDNAVRIYKKYEDTFSLDFKDRNQVRDYIAKYTDETMANMLRKNKLFDYEIDTLDGLRNHNLAYYIDDVDMTTNDYVFYALNDGRYDGVLFKNIKDYGGTPDVPWKEAKGGDVLAVFNSKQFKNWDNPNPTDSKYISYQKFGTAGKGEKGVSAAEGLNIRNFKNGKTVQELADNYGIKTNIVDSISTPEGQKAYGMYGDRMITLAKDLKESTVPHELLHGVFDIVDNTRKTEILDGIKKRLKVDDIQAEEWLADNFSEYYRTGKFDVKGIPTTFVGKVKQFFQQIKEYIDGTYANRKEIGKLFDDIIDGRIEGEYGVYSSSEFRDLRNK